jgi:PAS domain S-box-containing protein
MGVEPASTGIRLPLTDGAASRISDVEALTLLYEVGNRCVRVGGDFAGCLDAILDAAVTISTAEKGNVQLLDPETGSLVIAAHHGFHRPFLDFFSGVQQATAACGTALGAAKRVMVEDVKKSELFVGSPSLNVLLAEDVRAVQSTPLVSSAGCVVGMISTHFSQPTCLGERELRYLDLLARQAADYVERIQTEQLLIDKELQLERITAQTEALLTWCSRDYRYLFVNKASAAFLGKRPELIIGKSIVEVMGEEAFKVIHPYIDRVLAGERVEYETEITYAGAGLRYMHVIYVPDVDSQGAVCGWIGTISDITHQKRLEQHLRKSDRQKDEFLAILAHELRNPLAPIRYALATTKKSERTPEQQARAEEMIERQVSHMSRLLDDLLDVSRITLGKFELKKSQTELAAVIGSALEAARPAIDVKRHSVSIDLPSWSVSLEADPVRLSQVFANLLINAAKYTDPGGSICLRATQEDGQIVVSVRDNGIGISAELMPRLFTLFTQDRAAVGRSEGGLGVGLSLVRGIVELHGGHVEVSSEGSKRGSVFTVRMPVGAAEPQWQSLGAESQKPDVQTGLRLLLVDDNRDAADSCAMLLELSGHQVQTAYTGQDALQRAEIFQPDAFLLDIGLPDMNGFELAKRIRSTVWGKNAVLVAVTGWGQEEDRTRAFAAGFDHHLIKPVAVPALEAVLQSVSSVRSSRPTAD